MAHRASCRVYGTWAKAIASDCERLTTGVVVDRDGGVFGAAHAVTYTRIRWHTGGIRTANRTQTARKPHRKAKSSLTPRSQGRKNVEGRGGPSRRSDSALERGISALLARRCWAGRGHSSSAHRTRFRTRSSFVCGLAAIDRCGNCGQIRRLCGCYPLSRGAVRHEAERQATRGRSTGLPHRVHLLPR